ncbi:hypothetical protein ACFPRL_18540 [Pseudoclavibacter helvolus]
MLPRHAFSGVRGASSASREAGFPSPAACRRGRHSHAGARGALRATAHQSWRAEASAVPSVRSSRPGEACPSTSVRWVSVARTSGLLTSLVRGTVGPTYAEVVECETVGVSGCLAAQLFVARRQLDERLSA